MYAKIIQEGFMSKLNKVNLWQERLWKEIHNSLFDKYKPETEMDKVRLAWYAEEVFDDLIRNMSFVEM